MSSSGSTISRKPARAHGSLRPPEPHLFLSMTSSPTTTPTARIRLQGISEVVIGRSPETSFAADENEQGSIVRIALPDPWMSSTHAVLRRVLGTWCIEDANSTNGTLVNGVPIRTTELRDGDLVEAGASFFYFRAALAAPPSAPLALESSNLRTAVPGFATLLPSLAEEFSRVEAVARSSVSVLLRGESGTGKEVVAAGIHALSGRSGAFQAVNCGALPDTLVESELFGYRRGAFSGALEDRPGLVRSADRGTLFLDEIGDLPLSAQASLLRVLQEHEVHPLGSPRPVKVDIRVIAATHRDLDALALQEKFRADLLARLRGIEVRLPPLRERREDLGLLVAALLRRGFPDAAAKVTFSAETARMLLLHDWPANIRELEKCLETALVLAANGTVEPEHLPDALRQGGDRPRSSLPRRVPDGDQRKRNELVAALRDNAGNVSAAARALGKARAQVQRWIKRYGIDRNDLGR